MQSLGTEATLIFELQWSKENRLEEGEELDNSRTSMPVLARPCTPDVETSKHAGHMVDAPHHKKKKKPVAAMFG